MLEGFTTFMDCCLRTRASNVVRNEVDYLGGIDWMAAGVTRKHWPPVHGPPLRTGSVDYQRTGPRTTPTDPSTDHAPNTIKNKNKDFTYCLSNRSLVSAKFCALRWSTLGKCDRPGFSLERKLCHCRSLKYIFAIFGAVALHERPGSLIDLWFLSLRYFVYVWNSA